MKTMLTAACITLASPAFSAGYECEMIRQCPADMACIASILEANLIYDADQWTLFTSVEEIPMIPLYEDGPGQFALSSDLVADSAYFLSIFENGQAILTLHGWGDGAFSVVHEGYCKEFGG